MSPFRSFLVIFSAFNIVACLPVTSKPIENTPEHLAWEAWIMIPPTQNKTRKITPKSIFILPNKTTTAQITCPPDHRIDNSKCIKTVQINEQGIVLNHLNHLAILLNSSSSDYDYDYGEIEEPHKLVAETSNTVLDYNNGGPLKIDLLGQLPISKDDSKETDDFGSSSEDGLNPQPFRGEASSSTTISSTTTASTSESDNSIPEFSAKSSTTASPTTKATPISSIVPPVQRMSSTTESLTSSPSILTTIATTSVISLTSSTAETVSDDKSNKSDDQDYDDQTRSTVVADEMEHFTIEEYIQIDSKPDLVKELPLIQSIIQTTTVGPIQSTESTEEIFSKESSSSSVPFGASSSIITTTSFAKPSSLNTNIQILKATDNPSASKDFAGTTIQIQDDSEPIMESIESNNKFVYHHLGSVSTSRRPERTESTTPDVQEQLRIINKIIEENKKRAESGSKIQFPSNTFIQTDNLRADFIRFPESTASRIITPTMPTRLFTDTKVIPILRQPTVLSPTTSTTITTTTTVKQNTKPFWWLPSGWEVDRNGDRPLLLRFWSRASPTSSSPTTSGFRENSRSPTDNLYREISAQDVYNVLGARNWHRNTDEFN